MTKVANNSSITLRRVIFCASCFALATSLVVIILEKTRVTNIYTKPVSASLTTTSASVNSVDYSPATNTEKPSDFAKQQDVSAQTNNTQATAISITFSAAGQDNAGGPVLIRTILDGATGGSCAINLTKDSVVKSYTTSITWQGTYYSCNKDVPFADLSTGVWQLKLVATQDTKQGTATQMVEIK